MIAAGIDIGDTMHAIAVPPGRDKEPVRSFGAFTCDLIAIVQWLKQSLIDTVVKEEYLIHRVRKYKPKSKMNTDNAFASPLKNTIFHSPNNQYYCSVFELTA